MTHSAGLARESLFEPLGLTLGTFEEVLSPAMFERAAFGHPGKDGQPMTGKTEVAQAAPSSTVAGRGRVHGTMEIHGAAHPVTFLAVAWAEGSTLEARASPVVPYVAWGMRDPSKLLLRVEKEVEVELEVVGRLGRGNRDGSDDRATMRVPESRE